MSEGDVDEDSNIGNQVEYLEIDKSPWERRLKKLVKKSSNDRHSFNGREIEIIKNKELLEFQLKQYSKVCNDYWTILPDQELRDVEKQKWDKWENAVNIEIERIVHLISRHKKQFQRVATEQEEWCKPYTKQTQNEDNVLMENQETTEIPISVAISKTLSATLNIIKSDQIFMFAKEHAGKKVHKKKATKFSESTLYAWENKSCSSESMSSEDLLSSQDSLSSSTDSVYSLTSNKHHRHDKKHKDRQGRKLPTLEIEPFDGTNRQQYLTWWSTFKNIVHKNKHLNKDEKMAYLKRFLSGEPQAMVSAFPTKGSFYKAALKEVNERYGRTHHIIEDVVLRFENITNAEDFTAFRTLFNESYCTLMTLKSMGRNIDDLSDVMIPLLKKKLPRAMKKAWNKKCYRMELKNKEITISKFLKFLHIELLTMEEIPARKAKQKKSDKYEKTKSSSEE